MPPWAEPHFCEPSAECCGKADDGAQSYGEVARDRTPRRKKKLKLTPARPIRAGARAHVICSMIGMNKREMTFQS